MNVGIKGCVLITRPIEDAYPLADKIEAKGYHAICEPFLKIVFHALNNFDLSKYRHLILTSGSAVEGLKRLSVDLSSMTALTVGDQTAEKAKVAGFQSVISAGGNLDDLVQLIKNQDDKNSYLYVRGEHISKDIKSLLPDYNIDEVVVYTTEPINEISPLTEQVIMRGEVDAVLFYSARTAQAFRRWVMAHPYADNIAAGLKRTRALCLGPSMVKYLSDMPWKDVQAARAPRTTDLLALLIE